MIQVLLVDACNLHVASVGTDIRTRPPIDRSERIAATERMGTERLGWVGRLRALTPVSMADSEDAER